MSFSDAPSSPRSNAPTSPKFGPSNAKPSNNAEVNPTLKSMMMAGASAKGVNISTESINMVNQLCCSQEVFTDCADEIRHVCTILGQRSSGQQSGRSDQLKFLCERYVKRYSKRMEILQRYGGQQVSEQNLGWPARVRIFLERPFASWPATAFFIFLSLVVCLSSAFVVMQSVPVFNPIIFPNLEAFWLFSDIGASFFFLVEVVVRAVATTLDTRYKPWQRNLVDFFKSPSNLIDISSCLLPVPAQIYGREYSFMNVFRLLRMFRVFYFLRHFEAFEDLEVTLLKSIPSLSGPLIALIVGLLGFASIIYTLEQGSWDDLTHRFMVRNEDCEDSAPHVLGKVQCDRSESLFVSAVHAMWFVLITFLSVGYGDLVPLTFAGRFMGSITIIAGTLFMAMPIAIVGTNFTIAVDRLRGERRNVRAMLARRQYQSEDRLLKALEMIHRPALLPSIAFCRFLRLTLRQDYLDLSTVTKRVPYYIDLYLERIVGNLSDPTKIDRARKLSARATMERKPFSSRLTLIRREAGLRSGTTSSGSKQRNSSIVGFHQAHPHPCVIDKTMVFPLHQPLTIKIGTGRDCLVRLLHTKPAVTKMLHYTGKHFQWTHSFEAKLLGANNRSRAIAGAPPVAGGGDRQPNNTGSSGDPFILDKMLSFYSETECGSGDCRFLGEHHASLSFVNFGGTYDRLYVIPVTPFSTMVGDLRTARQANTEVNRMGEETVIRFDPTATEATDSVQVVVKRGVKYAAINQIARPLVFEPPQLPKAKGGPQAAQQQPTLNADML